MITDEILRAIDESVLCWLATSDNSGQPNVSPKEIFLAEDDQHLLIANIASPQSINNIFENSKVCASFIHIFKQKGFKLYGTAREYTEEDPTYPKMHSLLFKITGSAYPIQSIIKIKVESVSPIIAPSYFLFPNESEESKIEQTKKHYLT